MPDQPASLTPEPLYDPATCPAPTVFPVEVVLGTAREALASMQNKNIHSHGEMLVAASTLDAALRMLVTALDARASGRW